MATNEHGLPDSSDPIDLDRLIGELETEAARRRAEPGYPHDADARLHFELARMAPNPPGNGAMRELVAQVEETASSGMAPWTDADSGPAGARRRLQVLRRHLEQMNSKVTSLGLAAAAAVDAVTGRLEQLEDRVRRLEPPAQDTSVTSAPPGPSDTLEQWRSRLAESLPAAARVLYATDGAHEVVAQLRAAGVDAYGLTATGARHQPGPDVRRQELVDHLHAVPDGALGAVLLVGPPEAMSPHDVGPLVAELGRVARMVVIVSEAPWWWRLRLGAVDADLAPGRPFRPRHLAARLPRRGHGRVGGVRLLGPQLPSGGPGAGLTP